MSKRLPYPDFGNGHVDIKLKLLMMTCKSILTWICLWRNHYLNSFKETEQVLSFFFFTKQTFWCLARFSFQLKSFLHLLHKNLIIKLWLFLCQALLFLWLIILSYTSHFHCPVLPVISLYIIMYMDKVKNVVHKFQKTKKYFF